MGELQREFGRVELSVRVATPEPGDVPLSVLRGRARAKVKGCRACELRDNCNAPVAFTAPERPLFMVLGEAPGPEEDKLGKPFVGPSGKLLRATFEANGLSSSNVAYVNAASCFPNDNGKVTQPLNEHLARCRENMFAQMQAAWCQIVLLVGATAIRTWRFDMKVERVNGKVYVWDDQFIVIPCIHPAAVLRHAPGAKDKLNAAVEVLAKVVRHEETALTFMDDDCIRCDTHLTHIDRDGVGYCDQHWPKGQHERTKSRQRWDTHVGTNRLL